MRLPSKPNQVPYINEQDFLSKINAEKKAFERNLDDLVALGMDRAIQVLIEHVEYVLSTEQDPTDYNPPPGKGVDMKPTKVSHFIEVEPFCDCVPSLHCAILTPRAMV